MRTQPERDEETVSIAAGLGLFVIVFAVGAALLWAAGSAFDWSEQVTSLLPLLLVTAGAAAAVGYLIRAGRR